LLSQESLGGAEAYSGATVADFNRVPISISWQLKLQNSELEKPAMQKLQNL
jgi:hypothetical protein